MSFPIDGFLCRNQIVIDQPGRFGCVAKGFSLHLPSLEHAPDTVLNAVEDELRVLLRGMQANAHFQFQFSVTSDYKDALLGYYDATENLTASDVVRTQRNRKFTHLWQQLEDRKLRREQLHLYVNLPATTETSSVNYESILASSANAFDQYEQLISQVMESIGGSVTALDDDGHYAKYLQFFNPSRTDVPTDYDPLASIQDNCFLSDASPVREDSCNGFWMDGHYHGIIAIKSPPQATFSGMIRMLTALPLLDYSITVNVQALDISVEIRREEKAAEKLQHALRHQHSQRMQSALEARHLRVQRLMSDEVVPLKAQFIIRAWDPSLPRLQAKLSALQSAIVKMHGATYYAPAFPSTARRFFIASMPGWTRDTYDECSLLVEDHNLANLLPVSSASVGHLKGAEALYPGTNGNLVGIKIFVGHDPQPQHIIVSGTTGGGKSTLVSDLMLQTELYYGFTAIVDIGMSHAPYMKRVSNQPSIILRPEGTITFNYLDTNRLPLSPQHLGDATAMVAMMTGADHQQASEQSGLITKALQDIYRDRFQRILQAHPEHGINAARCSLLIDQLRETGESLTLTEAFLKLTSACTRESGEFDELLSVVSEDQATHYLHAHMEDPNLFRLLFAFADPGQMPRHSDLTAWCEKQAHASSRRAEKYDTLATQLAEWNTGGRYGDLVDGITNVSFSGSHVHIELEKVRESSKKLLALAAFLVTNQVRNEIMTRPLEMRKRIVLEEFGGFKTIPGGAQIASEFYQRSRKKNTCVISVLQQTQILEDSPEVESSVLGNTAIGIFLQQRTPAEVDYLSKSFSLPQSTHEAILRFNDPSPEQGAPFIYYHKGTKPIIATARHILTDDGDSLPSPSESSPVFGQSAPVSA